MHFLLWTVMLTSCAVTIVKSWVYRHSTIGISRLCAVRSWSARLKSSIADGGVVEPGHVYFVATPLGNLKDITLRGKETLSGVDIICAEDTRHTISLLRHLQIPHKQLVSHHEHNHATSIPYLVNLAKSGKSIAVVSDAGTPGISDPGTELAAALAEGGVTVHPVPGCSAVAAALSICGFPCTPFTFVGFLPVKGAARKAALEHLAQTKHTVVFYEAPHRIQRTLRDIASHTAGSDSSTAGGAMAGRRAVCCRELTKLHEQISHGTVAQLLQALDSEEPRGRTEDAGDAGAGDEEDSGDTYSGSGIRSKGEFTVVLGPVSAKDTQNAGGTGQETSEERLVTCLEGLRSDGMRRSEAVKLCMEMLKLPKSVVYSKALSMPAW